MPSLATSAGKVVTIGGLPSCACCEVAEMELGEMSASFPFESQWATTVYFQNTGPVTLHMEDVTVSPEPAGGFTFAWDGATEIPEGDGNSVTIFSSVPLATSTVCVSATEAGACGEVPYPNGPEIINVERLSGIGDPTTIFEVTFANNSPNAVTLLTAKTIRDNYPSPGWTTTVLDTSWTEPTLITGNYPAWNTPTYTVIVSGPSDAWGDNVGLYDVDDNLVMYANWIFLPGPPGN